MDPMTMQAMAGFGSAAAQAMSGGPSSASGYTDARAFMDGSGWTVSTGRAKATGGTITKGDPWGESGQAPAAAGGGAPLMAAGMDPTIMLALLAVGFVAFMRRKG
jgi:hypothetical protein